jgi:hypothetical protein
VLRRDDGLRHPFADFKAGLGKKQEAGGQESQAEHNKQASFQPAPAPKSVQSARPHVDCDMQLYSTPMKSVFV